MNILIEAAEVLDLQVWLNPDDLELAYITTKENKENHLSEADIAQALRLKLCVLSNKDWSVAVNQKYMALLKKQWKNSLTVGFVCWLIFIATPIQKIEAALAAIKGE